MRQTLMLAIVIGMGVIATFNENVVNVALVYIQADFGVSSVTSQWLVTGYMIVSAVTSGVCAFLLHRFTLRSIVFSAGGLFVAGCIAAALAPNYPLLLVFRLLQAIGTGLFVPVMMATILKVGPPERMGTLVAIGNMCITLGPMLGPFVTGAVISAFPWRALFLPAAIVMVVLLALAAFFVSNVHELTDDRLDVPSIVLAAPGLTFFMYGLTQVSSNLPASIAALAAGALLLALFARRQFRIPAPFLNLTPFKDARFVIACLMLVVAMMSSFSTTVLLPEYLQDGVGVTAFLTGLLILLPMSFDAIFTFVGGSIFDRRGEFPLLPVGYLIMALALLGMCVTSRNLELWPLIVFTCVNFVAVGITYTVCQSAGLVRLSEAEHPHGVSIMSVTVMVAAALATSLYGGVAQAGVTGAIAEGFSQSAAQGIGFSDAMIVGVVFSVIALLLSFAFARRRPKTRR